jgi:hypothetical protein
MNTVMKCPKCGFQESILSSRPSANDPPCPRCTDFVRMVPVPPPADGKTLWSTGNTGK